jgi:hypothetical protein
LCLLLPIFSFPLLLPANLWVLLFGAIKESRMFTRRMVGWWLLAAMFAQQMGLLRYSTAIHWGASAAEFVPLFPEFVPLFPEFVPLSPPLPFWHLPMPATNLAAVWQTGITVSAILSDFFVGHRLLAFHPLWDANSIFNGIFLCQESTVVKRVL